MREKKKRKKVEGRPFSVLSPFCTQTKHMNESEGRKGGIQGIERGRLEGRKR